MTLSAKNFEELLRSIRNRVEHPQGDFNKRANVRHVYSALNSVWRDRATGETLAEVYQGNGTVRVTLFDGQQRADGIGPDTRSAYREVWRAYRLARYDTADLRRQIATLQRQLGCDLGQALEQLNRRIDELGSQKQPHCSQDVRARHAAAIRAHQAVLRAQRERYEESLRTCRRRLLERTKERGDLALVLAAIRQEIAGARDRDAHVAHYVPDVTEGGLLNAVQTLLKLAADYAAMHRRATAAEARAEQWKRTVERLEAEQPRAMVISHDALLPVGVSSESVAEAGEVRVHRPTSEATPERPAGSETPTDRPQDAPDAARSA